MRRPKWITKVLLQDLRDQVVAAIDGGLSSRGAAARRGVSVSRAIHWKRLAREHGRGGARKLGGDQSSLRFRPVLAIAA